MKERRSAISTVSPTSSGCWPGRWRASRSRPASFDSHWISQLETAIATGAAVIATGFALDLARDFSRQPRPHTAAYGAGIGLFALATWALAAGLAFGWEGWSYRTFFLLGAILNIPVLAVGSFFLVVGRKAGNLALLFTGAIGAISTTLTTTVPFARPLPEAGI